MRLTNVCLLVAGLLLVTAAPVPAQQQFSAILEGSQEVPSVPTPASGIGSFTLRADDVFEYEIEFTGLTSPETVAHIHGPGAPGVNAPAIFGLPLGSPKIGSVGPLTAQQKDDLMAGLWYVNVHTELYPAGEIRGQITISTVSNDAETWGEVKLQFEAK